MRTEPLFFMIIILMICFSCSNLSQLQKGKKMGWDFETIDGWNNDFGDSAWDYRGGFTNKGGYIDSTCNHSWYAETRLRKKKK